jgi:hypothetical protein
MKVALACRSALLEQSLEKFLKNRLVSPEDADLLITDYPMRSDRPVFRIGMDKDADLQKPFSRSQLMIRLEEKVQRQLQKEKIASLAEETEPASQKSLEEKIEALTRRFVTELTHTIKEHYETK